MFETEEDLRLWLIGKIKERIHKEGLPFIVLESKNIVDIIICKEGNEPDIYFLEIKLFQEKNNRIGIGTPDGTGFQTEILHKTPRFFKNNLRWVIADKKDQFVFAKNDLILEYISGNELGGKQNNIQTLILEQQGNFNYRTIANRIFEWLINN